MKPKNDGQALTPNSICDDEISPPKTMGSHPSQYGQPRPKKAMTSAFGSLRARHCICLVLFSLSLLFVFRYNARNRISLLAPSSADSIEWESLTEADQLAEAVTALSQPKDSDQLSADSATITLIRSLDQSLVPQAGHRSKSNSGRLIVVGDIHGMKSDLERLLVKLDFDSTRDHLVCAGDMISKGPDSIGVLELLMQLGASAVRGNHEDGVLKAWKKLHANSASAAQNSPSEQEDDTSDGEVDGVIESRGKKHRNRKQSHKALAKQLTKEQVKWLKDLPVILKIGDIEGMGSAVVVHAGLMPGLELKKQDPYMVMNIRTIHPRKQVPSERHKGRVWTKVRSRLPLNVLNSG